MSYNVTLFSNFSKPDNSTKRPSGGTQYSCLSVEPCGILSPRISFNQGNQWNPYNINYAYIAEWDRYYWIREWTYTTGRWYADMEVDVLATWKSDILRLDEYVVRSAKTFDGTIIDNMYPATTQTTKNYKYVTPWPHPTLETGAYVIGIIGNPVGEAGTGGVNYYVTGLNFLNTLMNHMLSDTAWIGTVAELSDELLKCLVNPTQYITSIMWFPVSAWGEGTGSVYAGWWDVGVGLPRCKTGFSVNGSFGTIGSHPQSSRGSYLNKTPYTNIHITFPPFGSFDLDPDVFVPGTNVQYQVDVDPINGMGTLYVFAETLGDGPMLEAKIGVPLSVGQSNSSVTGTMSSLFSRGIEAAQNYPSIIDKVVMGAAGAIGNAVHTATGNINAVGYAGGVEIYKRQAVMVTSYRQIVPEDNVHFGRPLCKKVTLGSMSGFTQVESFDTNIGCTQPEHTEIKQFLERGIFIE